MSTIIRRTIRSIPHRTATQTWERIVEILTRGKPHNAKSELLSVTGAAASIITEMAPRDAAIVVTCDGPRTRVYCSYDDDAIDASDSNEESIGFDPLEGDWRVSLPCLPEDLDWVQKALKAKSSRITARDKKDTITVTERNGHDHQDQLEIDPKGFQQS